MVILKSVKKAQRPLNKVIAPMRRRKAVKRDNSIDGLIMILIMNNT